MKKATDFLNEMQIPFEVNALSAHRTPEAVEVFAKGAKERGIKDIVVATGRGDTALLFKERLTKRQYIGIALGLVAIVLMSI
jgi:5-(carboxyamino)imidazole ribonucleotide mutase